MRVRRWNAMKNEQARELIGMTTAEADEKLRHYYACGFHEIDSDDGDIVYEDAEGLERIVRMVEEGESAFDPDVVTDAWVA
jgi:hypothetical protein